MSLKNIDTAIILAGGKGTRLLEQTEKIPKPLVEIGGTPILIHIMRHLAYHGVKNFIIAAGYKKELIQEYFYSQVVKMQKEQEVITFNSQSISSNEVYVDPYLKGCSVQIVDSGLDRETAERILYTYNKTCKGKDVIITYGDTVSNVDLSLLEDKLYANDDALITLLSVPYSERFGVMKVNDETGKVEVFSEKSKSNDSFINGGFIFTKAKFFEDGHIKEEDKDFSFHTLTRATTENITYTHIHNDFWFAMDSQRDYLNLSKIYEEQPELFIKK